MVKADTFEGHGVMKAWYDRLEATPAVSRRLAERPPARDISDVLKDL